MRFIFLLFLGIISVVLCVFYLTHIREYQNGEATIETGHLRDTAFSLVSSAENSSIHFKKQYQYIEDIGDGRGYTGGIIGFTSGTGDMLEVVEKYNSLKPRNNVLKHYLSALKKVNGTSSHKGLGKQFEKSWEEAASDKKMIQAQNYVLDKEYMQPAIKYAKKDNLGPLGEYIYYDALVVHGPGDRNDASSFQGIRKAALLKKNPPSKGGDEGQYLNAFLDARTPVMEEEAAHSDLSRINAQRKFIREEKFSLQKPLKWTMYGKKFELKR